MSPATRRGLLATVVAAPVPASWIVFFFLGRGLGLFARVGLTVATVLASAWAAFWVLRRFRLLDPQATSLRSLFFGLVSPGLAAMLGLLTYALQTRESANRDADFVFRLSTTAAAMTLPFVATLVVAALDRRRGPLGRAARVGVGVACASLALTWLPINGLLNRQRQADNLALSQLQAPPFDTVDTRGNPQRLSDYRGKVVLINVWATWCGPCRLEMPRLERLYQSRKAEGLAVFGLSTEDVEVQKQFAQAVVVSYPLLTTRGNVPRTYSQPGRYPANFLIDRSGRLQAAPSVEKPFSSLEAAVDALLAAPRGQPSPSRQALPRR